MPRRAHRALGRLVDADPLRGRHGRSPTTSSTSAPARSASARRPTTATTGCCRVGLPPISADPPVHTWTRRLLLPWFSHHRVGGVRGLHPGAVPRAGRRLRRRRPGRRRRRLRPADPGAGHRLDARRARVDVATRSPVGCATCSSSPRTSNARTRSRSEIIAYFMGEMEQRRHGDGRRPDQRAAPGRGRRRAGARRARARHGRADADRRRRHHLVGHRVGAVAPRHPPRRLPPAGGRTRADADGDRGAAAGLLPGHDGAGRHVDDVEFARLPDA